MYVYMIVSKFRLLNTLLKHEGLFWLKILVNTNSLWKTIIINQYIGVKNEVSHDLKKRKTTQDQFKNILEKEILLAWYLAYIFTNIIKTKTMN